MSSNLFNNIECSLHFYQAAQTLSQEKNYSKCLIFLKIAHKYNPDYHVIHYSLSNNYYLAENYQEALEWNDKTLELLYKLPYNLMNEIIKYNTFALRLEIIEKIFENIEKIKETLAKFEKELNQSEFLDLNLKNTLLEKIRIKNDYLLKNSNNLRHVSINDRKTQAKEVYEMIKKSEDLGSCCKAKSPMYIISMSWFKKWKKYCYFHHITGDHSEKTEELNSIGTQIIDTLTSDEEEDDGEEEKKENPKYAHPGTINQKDLLELEKGNFLDPDENFNYNNEILKKGLEENKDYIIVNEKVWIFLSGIYQGNSIRRYVINVNDKDYHIVEVWLKKIKFVIWPNLLANNPNELETNFIYLSKNETIKMVKEKIQRILNYYPTYGSLKDKEFRIWKNFNYEAFMLSKQKFDEKSVITIKNGVLLHDKNTIEDSELNEDDIILIECKFFSDWTFILEKIQVNSKDKACGNCKCMSSNLLACVCGQVYYCNQSCQRTDWKSHSELCRKTRSDAQNQNNNRKIADPETLFTQTSKRGLAGLQNIGNTCFMNSALQCLSNVYILTKHFLSGTYVNEINENNVLGTSGKLARSYANLLEEVWVESKSHASTWEIKKIIAKLAPQFYGYNQQDSQEFLSYLLDGLHEDLNRVKVKPFVENKESEICDDEIVSKESWLNYLKRNQSVIVDYCAGQYKSTLVCPDCNKISITFDPFLIASLPIPAIDYTSLIIFFIFRDTKKTPIKLKLNLFSFITIDTLIKRIGIYLKIEENFIELCWIKEHLIFEFVERNTLIKKFKDYDGILFMFEKFTPAPQIKFEEKNFIQTEIQVFHKLSKKPDCQKKPVSYTRLILCDLNTTFNQLHLEVYKMFRPNIKNLYKNSSKINNFNNLFAKYVYPSDEDEEKNPSLINCDTEYKELFLHEKKDLFIPYTLYILKKKNEKNFNFDPIPFNNNTIRTIIKDALIHEQIKLQIRFEHCVKVEEIKLSVCISDTSHEKINDEVKKNFSIQECFELFTREEKLDKDNEWYCSKCKAHKQATKKMELYKLPEVLILHLKRFKTSRIGSIGSLYFPAGSTKINSFVEFPTEELDMKNFSKNKDEKSKYELIGVSNHYGEMNGGHYTAYCKNHFTNSWFEFDDTRVSRCKNENEVISEGAYMLFYKKIN